MKRCLICRSNAAISGSPECFANSAVNCMQPDQNVVIGSTKKRAICKIKESYHSEMVRIHTLQSPNRANSLRTGCIFERTSQCPPHLFEKINMLRRYRKYWFFKTHTLCDNGPMFPRFLEPGKCCSLHEPPLRFTITHNASFD
jgi:hypothetical protein